MEMTRKEILNSSEYWQERAETQCYIEGVDCTIQLVDKQQIIDKVCEWWTNNWRKYVMTDKDGIVALNHWKEDFIKTMKGE